MDNTQQSQNNHIIIQVENNNNNEITDTCSNISSENELIDDNVSVDLSNETVIDSKLINDLKIEIAKEAKKEDENDKQLKQQELEIIKHDTKRSTIIACLCCIFLWLFTASLLLVRFLILQ
ncbi:involucrin repeat-containing protein [Tieghemostelium lacteum]|uniref:Involucrin repeat-containing protein n=1 Tax=Tieghemostelium lacteum TaxID=361077 RepID=A0A151ZHY2_TIELA|nr:involucrin repeat-containing protein [Tieghemostelium lacteum]|eukprot:KYQ93509.1 involucrin repeat-containing protein [Tieghemostelium lacteum]